MSAAEDLRIDYRSLLRAPALEITISEEVAWLWGLTRAQAEAFYVNAYAENDRETLRWLGCNDLYFLLTCLLGRGDARRDWLYDRCREFEAAPNDHIDLWFREGYKSTIITFAGTIQEILKDPEITIGIFAHNKGLARSFLQQIRDEFEANVQLRALYPDIMWADPRKEASKWSLDHGIVVRRKGNPKEATVEGWGLVDGMPTGKHFKLMVFDDVVTEASVTTPEMIKKTTQMFELADNLSSEGGRQRVIGTRYHFGDTYGVILKRDTYRERRHPATHDGTFDGRPVLFTEDYWERKKSNQSRSTLAAQHLLNPLAGSDTAFDLRWMRYWEVRPRRLNVYILGDPSKGRNKKSDNTAIAIVGIDVGGNKYLLGGVRHRMGLAKRWQYIRDFWKRWSTTPGVPMVRVGYESFGLQTDQEYFEERMQIEKISFPIEELAWPQSGPVSKTQRIERLEPDLRMGRFYFPHTFEIGEDGTVSPYDAMATKAAQEAIRNGEKWRVARPLIVKNEQSEVYDLMAGLIEEYTFFPFAPRDDFLDALSRIYDMDPAPPVAYGPDQTGRPVTEPEVFVDGS